MFIGILDSDKKKIETMVQEKTISYMTVLELARKLSGVQSIRDIRELTRGEGKLLVEELKCQQ